MTGQTISHYKILEKLGEGGMGVVYKAEDLKLKRTVALKFLPKQLSIHGEERERFMLEAQAVSALNHPNICVVHEIDEVNGETFLAMEYVNGVTLREWIQKKSEQTDGYRKLAIREAVNLASQISEGLESAHEKGIIHRDIKSENIMVTNDGRAKIMDFGLAKLRGVSKLTKTGSTIGTIAYMSPEQVEGLETDHRTDIFSFGVVLYEMLAGTLPFLAGHETAVMYEIINVDPRPLAQVRPGIEDDLNRVVMKCLEKERDVRYQSMKDVAVDLKRYQRASEGKKLEKKLLDQQEKQILPQTPKELGLPLSFATSSPSANLYFGVIALLLVIVGVLTFLLLTKQAEPLQRIAQLAKLTSSPGLEYECALSPDGKLLAYTTDVRGKLDLLIQPLSGGKSILLTESDSASDDAQPSWSPDGSRIAFVSARDHGGRLSIPLNRGIIGEFLNGQNGDIFVVPSTGGTPLKLVDNAYYPAWSPDGKRIVYQSPQGGQWDLWTISSQGGTAERITNDADFEYQPAWSPDGAWILFARSGGGGGLLGNLNVIPRTGGEARPVLGEPRLVIRPSWSTDGTSIFYSAAVGSIINIWRLGFDRPSGKATGTPRRITVGEGSDVDASTAGNKMAFATLQVRPGVWEMNTKTSTLRKVSTSTMSENYPTCSPDGKTLLVEYDDGSRVRLRLIDLAGNLLSQLTPNAESASFARWSPDGRRIVYRSNDTDKPGLVIQSLGDLTTQQITKSNSSFPAWSLDGKYISFGIVSDSGITNIWIYDIASGTSRRVTSSSKESSFMPAWSPDGKWLTYNLTNRALRRVMVIPSSGGTPRQLTQDDAEYSHPQWSPKNPELIVCLKNHKNVCLISVSTGRMQEITRFADANVTLDYPSWSFDGEKIYFSLSKKTGDIYLMEGF